MKKNIIVSGSHRSGSTWIGNVISSSSDVRYVHEPFNIAINKDGNPLQFWFQYVDFQEKHENVYLDYIKKYYTSNPIVLFNKILSSRSLKDIYIHLADYKGRWLNRTLVKDPIAIFSLEWLYDKVDCDVVIAIRHPAAFVASLVKKDWSFDFRNFTMQNKLMNTYLSDYIKEIEMMTTKQASIIDQGILLWNIIYSTVHYYKNKYKNDWIFVKHEDLSKNPTNSFKELFSLLDVKFTTTTQDFIIKTTQSKETKGLNRNSKKNIYNWQSILSREEINKIKKETHSVWTKFYKEADWV